MYEKTVWKDHLIDSVSGEVIQQGTRFEQSKMNHIEAGIYEAHKSLKELENTKVKEFVITLASEKWTNNTYTIKNSLLFSNTSGMLIVGVNTDQAFAELKAARISKSVVLSSGSLVIYALGLVPTSDINLILQIKSTASNEFIIDLPSGGGDADTLGHKMPTYYASKDDLSAIENKNLKVNLLAENWEGTEVPLIYTIINKFVKADERQLISVAEAEDTTAEEMIAFAAANIRRGTQSDGSFTLKCWGTKPEIDLRIDVTVGGLQ